MVAVIDHIFHFVKLGRIVFSGHGILHSATEMKPRFEILYANIVAVMDSLSDQKSKVFFHQHLCPACLSQSRKAQEYVQIQSPTARAAFSTLTSISWLQLKRFRPYFYGLPRWISNSGWQNLERDELHDSRIIKARVKCATVQTINTNALHYVNSSVKVIAIT